MTACFVVASSSQEGRCVRLQEGGAVGQEAVPWGNEALGVVFLGTATSLCMTRNFDHELYTRHYSNLRLVDDMVLGDSPCVLIHRK